MKKTLKLFVALLAVMMVAAMAVNAGMYDDAFADLSLSEFALYEQGTLDAIQLRAFAVDPNGKYYYGGFLNGGTPTVYQFDAKTGNEVCTYQFDDSEDPGAYIKAIAADSRGYVYMGVANKANNGAVYFAICKEAGLEQIKWVKIEIEGKVGINGADVLEKDGKVYLYFVTNYDTDRIYRYDVTDVNNPTLDTSFGNGVGGGYVDLAATFEMADCNNICVSSDGMIYMAANTGKGSKGDTVVKIDFTGTGWMKAAEVPECFGVTAMGGYLLSCTYEGSDSKLYVLDQNDLSIIKVIGYDNATNFCQLGVIGNRIFMCDQGPDAVLVSNEIIFPIAETPVEEEPAADAPATDAPAADAPATSAPVTADAGIVVAAVVMAATAAVVLSKKH